MDDLEKAEKIARESDYAFEAAEQESNPINFADAAVFVLIGNQRAADVIGKAIHYPECWDTACYPDLKSALSELYEWFKCSDHECSNNKKKEASNK